MNRTCRLLARANGRSCAACLGAADRQAAAIPLDAASNPRDRCRYMHRDTTSRTRNGQRGGLASVNKNGRRQGRRAAHIGSGPPFRGLNAAGESVFHEPHRYLASHFWQARQPHHRSTEGKRLSPVRRPPRRSQLEFRARSSVVVP